MTRFIKGGNIATLDFIDSNFEIKSLGSSDGTAPGGIIFSAGDNSGSLIVSTDGTVSLSDIVVASDLNVGGSISAGGHVESSGQFISSTSSEGTVSSFSLDFSSSSSKYVSLNVSSSGLSFSGANYQSGVTVSVRVINSNGTTEAVSFPSNWVFIGDKPSDIEANKTAVLSVTSFGSSESDCIAAWGVQG